MRITTGYDQFYQTMKNYISTICVVEIVLEIRNVPNYGFGKDGFLYNLKTQRRIKKTLNGRSIGYWIGKNFYSVSFLETNNMLIKPNNFYCPF